MNEKHTLAFVALIILFSIAMVGNIVLTLYFLNSRMVSPDFTFFASLGALVAQPCLFSIWCVLGEQKTIVRVMASMGMLIVLAVVYISLLVEDGAPEGVVLIIGGIILTVSAIVQVPLWIFRAYTKHVIVLPNEMKSTIGASQYGIKHLLISTTITAIVVTVVRANISNIEIDSPATPWSGLILFLLFFIVTASILTFVILAVVFNQRRRLSFGLLLLFLMVAAPVASLEVIYNSKTFPLVSGTWEVKEIANAFAFFIALASTILCVLSIFFAIGFRMVKLESRAAS